MVVWFSLFKIDPLMSASVQMIIAGIAQTLLGLILGESGEISLNTNGLLAIGYLIFIGSIFGYGSYIYAIEHLSLSLVSTYAYINPVIALFLGWLVLNEKLDFIILLATIIIIAGVIIVKQGVKKQVLKEAGNSSTTT
jgi:drug/metabolite transporter (DMT)-like permease